MTCTEGREPSGLAMDHLSRVLGDVCRYAAKPHIARKHGRTITALELTHWEVSYLLHTCNLGDTARTGTNPFTGEPVEFPMDDGLTHEEMDAPQDVFEENGIDGPEPDGEGYAVFGPEGPKTGTDTNASAA